MAIRYIFAVSICALAAPLSAQERLTLDDTARLAIERAPFVAHHRANASAARERIAPAGKLPDPQLTLGAINVPVDTFSFDQDDMTMLSVGIRQAIPPRGALKERVSRAEAEAGVEDARSELEQRETRREARRLWLDIYRAEAEQKELAAIADIQGSDARAAEQRYRAASGNLQASLKARQAAVMARERVLTSRYDIARLRASLARLIGDAAMLPLADNLVAPAVPASSFDPADHPAMRAARADMDRARAETRMARTQFHPGVMLDFSYGFRAERADMVTAQLSVDLPLRRHAIQTPQLHEKEALAESAIQAAEDQRLKLVAEYDGARAMLDAALARARLIEQERLPLARREAESSVAGFARDQDLVREARMRYIEAEFDLTTARLDAWRALADLDYLLGEDAS